MSIFSRWGTFVLVPEIALGGVVYMAMAANNSTMAFLFALYVAGMVAAIVIVYAMICNNEIGVTVSTASLAMVLAVFCATASALSLTIALALISGALIFVAKKFAKKE